MDLLRVYAVFVYVFVCKVLWLAIVLEKSYLLHFGSVMLESPMLPKAMVFCRLPARILIFSGVIYFDCLAIILEHTLHWNSGDGALGIECFTFYAKRNPHTWDQTIKFASSDHKIDDQTPWSLLMWVLAKKKFFRRGGVLLVLHPRNLDLCSVPECLPWNVEIRIGHIHLAGLGDNL